MNMNNFKKQSRPTGKIKRGEPRLKKINGITYMWIPNPLVKDGGYWRKLPKYMQ